MRLDAATRINRVRRSNEWRGACGKPRRRRSEGTGEACVLLRAEGIRTHLPRIDSDILKFWLLAASYADELGTAWAAQKEFMRYGYNARKVTQYFELTESLGLIRFVRKGEKDPVTRRMLHNVYQFNPAILYVKKALRPAAAALTETPFRFPKPIPTVREEMNHNQVLGTNTTNQDQKPRPQTNVSTDSREGEKPAQNAKTPAVSDMEKQKQVESFDTKSNAPIEQGESPVKKQSRSASGRKPQPTPPPLPPAPPAGSDLYHTPLDNVTHERLAEKLNALTGDLSMPNARYLVTAYGESPCSNAIQVFCARGVDTLTNPAGFLRSTIQRKAKKSEILNPDSNSKIVTVDEWWIPQNQEKKA